MSVKYGAVGWNRQKRFYDAFVVAGVIGFVAIFVGVSLLALGSSAPDPMVLLIRATGVCAALLLTFVLCIGPLARFDPRWLVVLYNRRHLGVVTFLVALTHATLVTLYYHGFGELNPLVSLLVNTARAGMPFEYFGIAALAILFLMAATSHDFWLKNLSPRTWKSLHMLVYVAFGSLAAHVAFGALRDQVSGIYPALVGAAIVGVTGLHLLAARREAKGDVPAPSDAQKEWVEVCDVDEIPEKRARVVCVASKSLTERVAVFRHDGKVSAVSNVCEHQNGPLGEGKIVDGCITCPWHGYQYLPESGCAPAPFTEKINTYQVRIDGRRVFVRAEPVGKGVAVEAARIDAGGRS